ncbi:MAG: hypothetical protein HC831_05745 [Chloroflexia bacterium]|nr:hypothetical protein [Chloroflexia bacterium]
MKKYTLTGVVAICLTTSLFSQYHPSDIFHYKGKVVTEENKPISFAHLVNKSHKYATISDTTGNFRIPVSEGDSIKITAIGYHTKYIVFKHAEVNEGTNIIRLKKRAYDLPVVNINDLRWQVFKSEFLEKEVEGIEIQENISNWLADLVFPDEIRMIYQHANRKDWLYLDRYKR